MRTYTYFLSDAHLGCKAIYHQRTRERRLVNFLESIRDKARAIYLLGDVFDFWYEYRSVVPRGFTRLLGKLSELTDDGVEVHYFVGNHDQWMRNYLQTECGVVLHRKPQTIDIDGRIFYLAHGDGLGTRDWHVNFIQAVFHSPVSIRLFGFLHPRIGMALGQGWAKKSQEAHQRRGVPGFLGEEREDLVRFASQYYKTHPDINYFIFGHRHIELDYPIGDEARVIMLGEWIERCTYAVFDGKELRLTRFIEGETNP